MRACVCMPLLACLFTRCCCCLFANTVAAAVAAVAVSLAGSAPVCVRVFVCSCVVVYLCCCFLFLRALSHTHTQTLWRLPGAPSSSTSSLCMPFWFACKCVVILPFLYFSVRLLHAGREFQQKHKQNTPTTIYLVCSCVLFLRSYQLCPLDCLIL